MASEVYTISKGKSLASGYAARRRKRLEEEEKERAKQALFEGNKKAGNKTNENSDDTRSKTQKVWDQINVFDNSRTFKQGKAQNKKNAAEQGGDVARSLLGNTAKGINTVAEGSRSIIELERALAAKATGNEEAYRAALERGTSKKNSLLEEGRGLLGQGGTIDSDTATDMDTKDLLKASLRGGAGIAGEVLPGARGFSGASKGVRALRAAGEGSVLGGVGAAAEEGFDDEEGFDLKKVGQSAAIGGLLGVAGNVAGIRRASSAEDLAKRKPPTGDPDDAAEAPAGLLGTGQPEQKLLPARTDEPVRPLADIDAEIEDLQTNGVVDGDAGEIRTRFAALQKERERAIVNEQTREFTMNRDLDRERFEGNGLPNDPDEARAALDEFDNGNMPESVYRPAQPVRSVDEVVAREDMPVELKQAASEIAEERAKVTMQMNSLMSPLRKQEEINNITERYQQELDDINMLPEPQRARELAALDEDYNSALDELDEAELADADQVDELVGRLNDLTTGEQNIVMDTNQLMKEAPDNFRDIDEVERDAQRQALADNADQAERFNSPQRIVNEVADAPDPVRVVEEQPQARQAVTTEVIDQTDNLPDFKNITGSRLAFLKVMSPSQILEKMGRSDIFTGLVRAEVKLNKANELDAKTIGSILERTNGNKQLQSQIIDYLEGNRKTLSATDTETADMIRSFLDEKRTGLEQLGFKTLDKYFPHMINKDDDLAKRLFKGKTTGDINFGNVKQRLTDSDDFNRDIGEVLALYAQGYNKKVHLEPALKPLDDIRTQNDLAKAEAEWVDGYIQQLKGMQQSGVEKGFNQLFGDNKYREVLGAQRMVSAVATMGLNPGTAIRNLTQGVNTIIDIGPRYSTIGMMDGFRALVSGIRNKNSPEWKEMEEMGLFSGGVSKNYYDDLSANVNLRGKTQNAAHKAADVMMSMVRGTDIALRAQAYYGAKALGRSKGLEGEALKDFALKHTVDTQFMTSKVDMPIGLNGPGVRSFTQLATFSGKQAGFLKRSGMNVIKDADGKWRLDEKAAGNMLAAGISMMIATEVLKPTIGFQEQEWIPFYQQISPLIPGTDKEASESIYRSPIVTLLTGDGKGKSGIIQAIQTGDVGELFNDQWASVVPAGTQAKKSFEGFTTTESGVSKNPEGKVRYLQDQGNDPNDPLTRLTGIPVSNQLKASLFGQYSTSAGRRWIDEKFPTLTDSEMRLGQTEEEAAESGANIENVNRETQEAYYDYYSTMKQVKGRQKAYDAVKAAAVRGDVKGAARLAKDFNSQLNEAKNQYMNTHGDMPEPLKDDFIGRMINIDSVIDNLED